MLWKFLFDLLEALGIPNYGFENALKLRHYEMLKKCFVHAFKFENIKWVVNDLEMLHKCFQIFWKP